MTDIAKVRVNPRQVHKERLSARQLEADILDGCTADVDVTPDAPAEDAPAKDDQ